MEREQMLIALLDLASELGEANMLQAVLRRLNNAELEELVADFDVEMANCGVNYGN